MTKTLMVLAAALAVAMPVSIAASQSVFAQAQVQPQVIQPTTVTPQNIEAELAGDKPAIVILGGADCKVCTDIAKLAAKYPQIKFLQGKGSDFQAPDGDLPVIIVNIPDVGPTFQQEQFAPADLEKVIAERAAVAATQTAAALKVRAARDAIKKAAQPFDDELKVLAAEYQELWKPYGERIAAEKAKAQAATAPFEAQYEALDTKIRAAKKPLQEQLAKIGADARAAVQADPQTAEFSKKIGELRTAYESADAELQQLRSAGVAETDPAFKAVIDRMTGYEQTFKATMTAARDRGLEVAKPFIAQAEPLKKQLEAIDTQFAPQVADLEKKAQDAAKPFVTEINKISGEGKLMLKPQSEKLATVKANKARAIVPARDELAKAMDELQKTLSEEPAEQPATK
jgi:hypothetical protein